MAQVTGSGPPHLPTSLKSLEQLAFMFEVPVVMGVFRVLRALTDVTVCVFKKSRLQI